MERIDRGSQALRQREGCVSIGLQMPAEGQLDLLSLGALVHRLDPGPCRSVRQANVRFMSVVENLM
jgi:hypothetical protein